MRTDLNMRKGKMVAQGAHASIEAYEAACLIAAPRRSYMKTWHDEGTTKICVGVDSEEELLAAYNLAVECAIPCAMITDSGHTEFKGQPTRTCLAIGPYWSDMVDVVTGKMRLI